MIWIKQIFEGYGTMIRLYAFIALGIIVCLMLGTAYVSIKHAGRAEERAEQAETVRRKLNDATIADTAVTRCLADPACRLSDDGFKRK